MPEPYDNYLFRATKLNPERDGDNFPSRSITRSEGTLLVGEMNGVIYYAPLVYQKRRALGHLLPEPLSFAPGAQ